MICHWTGDDSEIWRRHEDEVDPDTLPELKTTDDRFESWTPWMKAGTQFTTPRGTRFTIVGVDKWGNCHAIADSQKQTVYFPFIRVGR